MEIRNLITFTKVAETQSLSKAAKELEYAQSTVTMQMQQLEQELGIALYERVGKQIRITQAGQELLTYANSIIQMSEAALQIGRNKSEQVDGTLRIGILESIANRAMTDQIQRYLQSYPNVELQVVVEKETQELLGQLRHNEIDLVITLDHYLNDSMLVHADDQKEEVHFYAGEEYSLASAPVFIRCCRNSAWERCLERTLLQKGVHQIVIQNQNMAITIAEKGVGMLLLPDSTAMEYLTSKRLKRLDDAMPETTYWRQTLYHRNKWLTGAMKAWLNLQKNP